MPDYYYIDLYFDPEGKPFREIVNDCVRALLRSGGRFEKVFMARTDSKSHICLGEHVSIKPSEIGAVAQAYVDETPPEQGHFISFPHLGRVMFRFDFALDNAMIDEIREEEAESCSNARDIGLSFIITSSKQIGKRVKASLSFWEEYVLQHGSPEIHRENIQKVLRLVEAMSESAAPFFGAMNSELHLHTDRSLDMLWAGKLPDGNDYALVGSQLRHLLDTDELDRRGIAYRQLSNKACLIQFTRKWG